MRKRNKFIPHLLIAILSFVGLLLFVNIFDPNYVFNISVIKIPSIIPFFFLLFLTIGGVSIYILKHIRRGLLVGIFLISFFLLQYLKVNNILYTLLLTAIIVLLEIFFRKKK